MITNQSNIPLFGQAWELTVTYATAAGSAQTTITASAWQPEALRMTFDVLQSTLPSPWWFADIVIYNMNEQNIQNTLLNATWATLKAGFQDGPNLYSVIWDGPVFQVLFDREDVTDQRVTLHCVATPLALDSIVNFSSGVFSSQEQIVARMASEVGLPPINPAQGTQGNLAHSRMTAKQFPRGRTVFGSVSKHLNKIAKDNFVTMFQDGTQAYMSEYSDGKSVPTPEIIYAPPVFGAGQTKPLPPNVTTSILGTPQQTLFGVIFSVLLDPRLKVKVPVQVVALDRTTVFEQLALSPNPNSGFPSALTSDLTFFVGQVRHSGDTRGNTWRTEVTGYTTTYAAGLAGGIFAAGVG